jgi:cyclic beta-1,2-glucan synthetase
MPKQNIFLKNHEKPIRQDILSAIHLEIHGEVLAKSHIVSLDPSKGINFTDRFLENKKILSAAYAATIKTLEEQRAITHAAEWLIDNFHIVEYQLKDIHDHLHPRFYKQLPKLATGPLKGHPRVLGIAWDFVAHTDSLLDTELFKKYIKSYQTIQPLSIGELWALPIALRFVLIENLRRIAARLVGSQWARKDADKIADELLGLGEHAPRRFENILRDLDGHIDNCAFVAQLVQRLRFQEGKAKAVLDWLDSRLAYTQRIADNVVHEELLNQTTSNATVRNIITSMRLISSVDWQIFFEEISLVDEVFRKSKNYSQMDFITRDRYRHALEDLARKLKKTEIEIAEIVLKKAQKKLSENSESKESDIGYYLISSGRYQFEKELGVKVSLRSQILRGYISHAEFFYVGSLLTLTLFLVLITYSYSFSFYLLLMAIIPASEISIALINRLTVKFLGPKHIPRLDFAKGIPKDLKTFVVVPTFLVNENEIETQVEQLEVHYLSNPCGEVYFALLSDWKDALYEHTTNDHELLRIANHFIEILNTKYGFLTDGKKRFYILHRKRLWNKSEQRWIGWERKRGKLSEFNRLLRGAKDTSFILTNDELLQVPQDIKYVITLDADTKLPRNAVAQLVGTCAHPLNHPKFDENIKRVVEGYGILQPRITPSLPKTNDRTIFQQISSGPCGVDPYAAAISDVYQDLFGEGSYTGKGIYHVDIFEKALSNRVPENRLLSHDLFEGNFARCGLLTDVEFFEEFPSHFEVSTARLHRWTRGDWQLLPWILGRGGKTISIVGRYKMFENLRRSLFFPSTFFLLISIFLLPGIKIFPWLLLGLLSLGLPNFFPFLTSIVLIQKNFTFTQHLKTLTLEFLLGIVKLMHNLLFLPYLSEVSLDAITRTLYRLLISKRKLLEWTTSAQTKTLACLEIKYFFKRMILIEIFLLAIANLIAKSNPSILLPISPILVMWLLAPIGAWYISLPPILDKQILNDDELNILKDIARKTWTFFETFVNEEENFLPPDNFQETPEPIIAHRSSPTNFGLYLLSVVSARDLGWISFTEMTNRLESTLAVLQNLPRYKGHFYNWYRTTDCCALEPQYISSVDNGNLAGHLIAVAQACDEFAKSPLYSSHTFIAAGEILSTDLINKLQNIAKISRKIFYEMDFNLLFDIKRQLFSIGMRVSDQSLDDSYYDLLASEARLLSFVAIAKGDISSTHWFRLGRTLAPIEHGAALVSWSGSMFEYLMPALVMQIPKYSLLEQTCNLIVKKQKSYAQERNVPWGISESAYSIRDSHLTYQYSNFGIPDLGLKRGLGQDLVIAPYATLLAAMFDSIGAIKNIKKLKLLNAEGIYGFYEAIDYTKKRLPLEKNFEIIKTYMAHHQGMSLVSINNVLNNEIMRRRFHREPIIQSCELLLEERTPRNISIAYKKVESIRVDHTIEALESSIRRYFSPRYSVPRTHLLSNGHYSLMLTTAGSGYSRYRELSLTRWREDVTRDNWGSYIYLRDIHTASIWSPTFQPTCVEPEYYEVVFLEDRAKFNLVEKNISSHLEIFVSPESNTEVRRLALTNNTREEKYIEITSYAEVVLNSHNADLAHPAFSNLFIQTEFIKQLSTLVVSRRPRSSNEQHMWMAHVIVTDNLRFGDIEYETDRSRFVGRGNTIQSPHAIKSGGPLSGTIGDILDPIMSLKAKVRLAPGITSNITFYTMVASSREEVIALAEKYHDESIYERTSSLAWTEAQIRLHYLNIDPSEACLFQQLANRVLYLDSSLRPSSNILKRNSLDVTRLWSHGISGDLPIVLLRIDNIEDKSIVRQLLRAHEYWQTKQLLVDLVILNERPSSYSQELYEMLNSMVSGCSYSSDCFIPEKRGNIFILRADLIAPQEYELLQTAARATLLARNGNLAEQVKRFIKKPNEKKKGAGVVSKLPNYNLPKYNIPELDFFNGLGGFSKTGHEYYIFLKSGQATPAPWINIIANPQFGFQVSESGAGYTWSTNSRENQITPWSNDPVSDPSGECFYIFDKDTGHLWSPTASPKRIESAEYIIRHGQGYSIFELVHLGIQSSLTQFVHAHLPVKISKLVLKNISDFRRDLTITSYLEWVLGFSRTTSNPYIITEHDLDTGAIFSYNPWNQEFGKKISFATFLDRNDAWTTDRTEFLGRNGSTCGPQALVSESVLSGKVGAGLDTCAAIQKDINFEAHDTKTIYFIIGQADNRDEARKLIKKIKSENIESFFSEVITEWNKLLENIQVETPDASMNIMLNRWLLYQTTVCRLWARSAFYQAGGAYGFRDQLQDSMAMIWSKPDFTKEQILRASERQFPEGDVQHWWHMPTGRGVRTHFSDDLLWLPFVVSYYINNVGDHGILDKETPFLNGDPLPLEKEDAYFIPEISKTYATVYEHCARALDHSLQTGVHGLPLIGGGDWNDGMNRVGHNGKGESVWLAWFLISTLSDFSKIAHRRGELERFEKWNQHIFNLKKSIEGEAWDGLWYRRAFYDDGTPLGSSINLECKIDSLAQTWGIISKAGDQLRVVSAMESVEKILIKKTDQLILLFAPPFDKTSLDPGYIKGYLPGVRENGGQYSHAAVWCIYAYIGLKQGQKATEIFSMINPINHSRDKLEVDRYKVEPYVLAADVYSEPPHLGRGGWTWYTGSASWMYRVGIEGILGLKISENKLIIHPCIHPEWKHYKINYRYIDTLYEIEVKNPDGLSTGVSKYFENSSELVDHRAGVSLVNDKGIHSIIVELFNPSSG